MVLQINEKNPNPLEKLGKGYVQLVEGKFKKPLNKYKDVQCNL